MADEFGIVRTADEIRAYCKEHRKPLRPAASDEGVMAFAEMVVFVSEMHLVERPEYIELKPFADWLQGKETQNEKK
jgi:hypothetical protein